MLTNFLNKIIGQTSHYNKFQVDSRMNSDSALRIELKNHDPVELLDFTYSFFSIADEYKRYVEAEYGNDVSKENINLYVKDIRSGSIIVDLVSHAPAVLPVLAAAQNIEAIIKFASYLKTVYDFLLGKSGEKPNISKINYKNISGFIEPVAKDKSSQMNIHAVINGDVNYIFGLSSVDANAAQNAAGREMSLLAEPVTGVHKSVVLYWFQARKDITSQAGDKAIIESISLNPIKTIFRDESVKRSMLLGIENPFTCGFLVDVEVGTMGGGKPVLYKVLNFYDCIDYPPQTNIKL